jgi:hypothetical protein
MHERLEKFLTSSLPNKKGPFIDYQLGLTSLPHADPSAREKTRSPRRIRRRRTRKKKQLKELNQASRLTLFFFAPTKNVVPPVHL